MKSLAIITTLRGVDADITNTATITDNQAINLDVDIPASTDPVTFDLPLTVARIKALAFKSDRPCTVAIKASGGSTIVTVTLSAANGYQWVWHGELNPAVTLSGILTSDPATAVVTQVVTTIAGTLQVRGIYDPTA